MGRRERRLSTHEFKAEVVGLVRSGRTVAEVSRDLDLTEGAVRTSGHRAKDRGSSLSVAEWEELSRLRRQVRVLEEERTILKKAAAFFARRAR
jgi:transposase